MKRKIMMLLLAQFLVFGFSLACFADSTLPPQKQTVLAKYITAKQAYEKYSQDPANVKILDVRTPGEYVFVGHAPMAANVPLKFLGRGLTDKNKPVMPINKDFVAEVTKRFNKTDRILVMCRSGARSAACVNLLAEAGFNDVYNITDGFEGDTDDKGQRTVNGWKNSGAPWTFKLDPALVY